MKGRLKFGFTFGAHFGWMDMRVVVCDATVIFLMLMFLVKHDNLRIEMQFKVRVDRTE
jgi:hypothetical protein